MATVSRARDTRLDQLVAIKRPHPGPPGNDLAKRMEREARAAASLSHPTLVTIHDYRADADGPYLVMELVEGQTLQVAAEQVGPDQVVEIGVQLVDALAAIHRAGVVHRDVEPSNVIMSDRGPLLTDFGIALDPISARDITRPGQVVATPSYAAPEVLAGDPPTSASDIYSLAVVIAEMSGRAKLATAEDVYRVLQAARAHLPEDRPDASSFGAALRGAIPTATMGAGTPADAHPAGDHSTLILETGPQTSAAPPHDGRPRRRLLP
jgi:serine/threonine protein kinase